MATVLDAPVHRQVSEEQTPTPRRTARPEASPATDRPERLMSLDAYRGFVMLAMASGGLGFPAVSRALKGAAPWNSLAYQFDHVPWIGCAFWDLIQPSFMFMVGVAMPYSVAGRRARGTTAFSNALHVLYRSLVLIFLGIFLSSNGAKMTNFTFVNVLTQIGLGYAFVYLLLGRGRALQLASVLGILAATWLAFFLYPMAEGVDWAAVGVKDTGIVMDGLFGHWNMNANIAATFDLWFLNLFPRPEPFLYNSGGYATLNFVPSMATMIFGLMAGEWLRERRSWLVTLAGLLVSGLLLLGLGWVLGETLCPLVKRLWTPSWAIFSTGWTLVLLAGFYWLIDGIGWRRWAFPMVVVGMNSIAMYVMAQLMKGWVSGTYKTHLGQGIFASTYGPIYESLAVVAALWLACFWMYRNKVFVRI